MSKTKTDNNNNNNNNKSDSTSKLTSEPRPPLWKVWLVASRPHTLTASVSPCLMGYTMCKTLLLLDNNESTRSDGQLSLALLTFLWTTFCFGVQLATNLHNDYADFVRGADTKDRVGQARATQRGWLSPMATAAGATSCLSVAAMVGLYLWVRITPQDWFVLAILLTSCFNAVAYTGGPYPLGYVGLEWVSIAYSGLGDIFSHAYFGFVATLMIPYFYAAMTRTTLSVDWTQLSILTIPLANIVTAILVVNNVRDRHQDVLAQKRTLAVRFGATFCRIEYTVLVLSSYAVMGGVYHPMYGGGKNGWFWSFLPFLTLPLAISFVQSIWKLEGAALNPYVGRTAQLQLLFCILQCTSLYLQSERE